MSSQRTTGRAAPAAPQIRIEDARIFVAIASAHNLTDAAAALGLPLHTVSRCLKRLESQAQVGLVRRSGQGAHLSEAGQRLLAACEVLVEAYRDVAEALRSERHEVEGILHLRAPILFARSVLAAIVPSF